MNEKWAGCLKAAFCRLCCRIKPDPKVWIFSSTDNRHFNYNSKYLFLYVRGHLPDIRPRYVINDDAYRADLQKTYGAEYFIETKSTQGILTVLKAGVWFTSAGLPVYGTGLSRNRRIVNLWHGIPLKTIALQDRTQSGLQKLYFRKIFSENYTDVVSTSEAVGKVMQAGLGVGADRIRIWGQPRCDCLYYPQDRMEFLERVYPSSDEIPLPEGLRYLVLYAPTFRTGKSVRLFPFADFDRRKMEEFLKEHGILLCIRLHLSEQDGQAFPESAYLRYMNEDRLDDITEGLSAFDLLITDYSSIYADFLLLNRPMVFLPYDLEEYADAHGFSFPYEAVTPGPKPQNMADFLQCLSEALPENTGGMGEMRPDRYEADRIRVRDLFHNVQEPCCERICREILMG